MAVLGTTTDMALSDLVQTTALAAKTCRLSLTGPEGDGYIFFERGDVVHAVFGDLVGVDAVFALLASEDEMEFLVDSDVEAKSRTVNMKWQELLMEGARRKDEGSVVRPPPRLSPGSSTHVGAIPGVTGSGAMQVPAEAAQPAPPSRSGMGLVVGLLVAILLVAGGVGAYIVVNGQRSGGPGVASAAREAGGSQGGTGGSADAAPATAGGTVEAGALTGDADHPPQLISGPKPITPPGQHAVKPTVVCRLRVDVEGNVKEATIYRKRADLADFESAALAAAKNFHFSPAVKDGKPVEVWINWPVRFAESGQGQRALRMKGSDTIGGALGPELAEQFTRLHPDVLVTVEALGSSTGFVGLFDRTADIGAASRPIKDKEVNKAAELGVELEEWVIAYDGIAVIVHPSNTLQSMTVEQLSAVFTGKVKNWAEVGGADLPIKRISRPSYSGTHGFFKNKVVRMGDKSRKDLDFAKDTMIQEHNEDLVKEVAKDPAAISYVGAGWLNDNIKAMAVAKQAGDAAVKPSLDTIRDSSYPVSRPLLMYTRKPISEDQAAFLRFVLTKDGQKLVQKHGFVDVEPPTADMLPTFDPKVPQPPPVTITRLFFEAGQMKVKGANRRILTSLLRTLQKTNDTVLVQGNSDSEGKKLNNAHVAKQRAAAVATFLMNYGIPEERITVNGAAMENPLGTNETAEGRAKNRRVDIFVIPSAL